MGRSPFFTVESIQLPPIDQSPENLELLKLLCSLKTGDKVSINIESRPASIVGIPRSISTYNYTPSSLSKYITYVVTSDNYAPGLSAIGLVAIALADPSIPEDIHIDGWVITSDGFIRETEHFTILCKLNGLEIVE